MTDINRRLEVILSKQRMRKRVEKKDCRHITESQPCLWRSQSFKFSSHIYIKSWGRHKKRLERITLHNLLITHTKSIPCHQNKSTRTMFGSILCSVVPKLTPLQNLFARHFWDANRTIRRKFASDRNVYAIKKVYNWIENIEYFRKSSTPTKN